MKPFRFTRWIALCLHLAMAPAVRADDDNQIIRLVVSYAAGGTTDALARAISPTLSRELGRKVVVENRPGAGGQIAGAFVKNAKPDGLTLLFTLDQSILITPLLVDNAPYRADDFSVLGTVGRFPWVFAVPGTSQAYTMGQFIALAQQNAQFRNYGVPVPGGIPQIMGQAVQEQVGETMEPIPYSGAAQLIPHLMGSQIAAGIIGVGETLQASKEGRIRPLAISGVARNPALPDVPTFSEEKLSAIAQETWYMLLAPLGMPEDAMVKINLALNKAIASKSVMDIAKEFSITLHNGNIEDNRELLKTLHAFWGDK